MLRVAAIAVAGTFMVPAAAHAALPPAHPPAKSVAGVKLSWPKATSALPGSVVTVKVTSAHRRTKLALIRVTSAGKPIAAVARRTLRSGTFKATLSSTFGTTYALRATIAGKTYSSWITTPAVTDPSVPIALVCPPAAPGPYSATLTANPPAEVAPTYVLGFTVTNTSPTACVSLGVPYGLQRQHGDGTWENVPSEVQFALSLILLEPGQSMSMQATIPADAPPGTYRVVSGVGAPDNAIPLYSPNFTVVAAVGNLSCDSISVATFTVDPASVVRGSTFAFTAPTLSGETGKWEVLDGSNWVDYPAGTVDPVNHTASLPNDAPAGTYRIHDSSTGGSCPGDNQSQSNAITLS
jgi:hypothetical protein